MVGCVELGVWAVRPLWWDGRLWCVGRVVYACPVVADACEFGATAEAGLVVADEPGAGVILKCVTGVGSVSTAVLHPAASRSAAAASANTTA